MAKITHPNDPNKGTRRRTEKGKGKWETMFDRLNSKSNSTPSWNRSTTPSTIKKGTKNINRGK